MGSAKIAVVVGGPSVEAEVSRVGGQAVQRALERAGYAAALFELEPSLARKLSEGQFDAVFPVTHGELGEDGGLQGCLEVLGLPYVGSAVLASALAASKPHAKLAFRGAGLPLAPGAEVRERELSLERIRALRAELGAAVIAKPASGGSALGVEFIRAEDSDAAALQAVSRVLGLDTVALVESFVRGRETTCGVLERGGRPEALPPTLIRPTSELYDFESKYRVGASEHVCPAPYPPELLVRIQEAALTAHRVLGCRDLSRTDFLVDDAGGSFIVLETNTLPGMTATSLFPEAASRIGLSFEELCSALVKNALDRPAKLRVRAAAMPV